MKSNVKIFVAGGSEHGKADEQDKEEATEADGAQRYRIPAPCRDSHSSTERGFARAVPYRRTTARLPEAGLERRLLRGQRRRWMAPKIAKLAEFDGSGQEK